MIVKLLRALLVPGDNLTLNQLRERVEDGTATILEVVQYLNLCDRMNRIGDHSNRLMAAAAQ